jgi:hypothetical protein
MVTTEAPLNAPRGWLAVLFGAPQAAPARRLPLRLDRGPLPQALATLAAMELTEERMRAATSGFEMGEYEPLARRN